ncbi:MAG: glucosidase [Planctomycetota bacterium]
MTDALDPERRRLLQDQDRTQNWKRWGPYLSARQWGTVREDYSADGSCWDYFPHEHARSRAYRSGEDGLLGLTDRQCRLCFGWALWNGQDPFLKERLFGLTGPQGNHGEDAKEEWFYLDNVPTHSWMRASYRYPQRAYPYQHLLDENKRRTREDREFELVDTGVYEGGRFFDVEITYAKAAPDDLLMVVEVHNRGPEPAPLHLLPQLWFRNTWSWGRAGEGYWARGQIERHGDRALRAEGAELGPYVLELDVPDGLTFRELLFTENETNTALLFGGDGPPFTKDAFHRRVVGGDGAAVNPGQTGSKAAFWCEGTVPAGGRVMLRLRMRTVAGAAGPAFGRQFQAVLHERQRDADLFYRPLLARTADPDLQRVQRQALAGLLWGKTFYRYDVQAWLEGDPTQPVPPKGRDRGRNHTWRHLYNRDVLSMPDPWEYPWYAAWDLAFHMVPMSRLDPEFAKDQLLLLLREWYMAPNGQLPAYEFAFGDVNPPVHAWACWRVYKRSGRRGKRDRVFLARAFHKLLLNFTWWVNQKDIDGNHVFGGGFLGLDNIGVFDRGQPLPTGGRLEQADGTAWMAFYCGTMLSIALELASHDPAYEDVASKFFEHFVSITHAMNTLGGSGLWDEEDGFYYDQIHHGDRRERLRVRSLVGLLPLCAVEVLEQDVLDRLPGFAARLRWFLRNEPEMARHVTRGAGHQGGDGQPHRHLLLAIPDKDRLLRVLRRMLDEQEFLSPFGVRSLSRAHKEKPFVLEIDGDEHRVDYAPAESTTSMFGGNSNWRGPVWFPVNFLLVEALERWGHFYGDALKVECPTGSGNHLTLQQVADELSRRLIGLFARGQDGKRPFAGGDARFDDDPAWRERLLFHEYFCGDTGRGCGASHQTGWTSLVAVCLEKLGRRSG